MANKLHKCTTLGQFKYNKNALKAQWKYKMENELMEEFKIVYFEGASDNSVGCVARQCSRSKSDVLKRIGQPGKKIHSHCPTVLRGWPHQEGSKELS
jgi:hypothetical protein